MKPIVLYDVPSNDPENLAWSSNGWKTRLSLDYKGLPYTNKWIEFPDVEPLCKKLGVPPDRILPDGSAVYTVPIIYDPNTESHHGDSSNIAKYLDKTYPDTPPLFPPGTETLQKAFIDLGWPLAVNRPLYYSIMVPTESALSPVSGAFWRRTREERMGRKMEANATDAEWRALERGLHALKGVLEANGTFFIGDKVVMADIVIVASLLWTKVVDRGAWAKIAALDDGWWGVYLGRFSSYIVMPSLAKQKAGL